MHRHHGVPGVSGPSPVSLTKAQHRSSGGFLSGIRRALATFRSVWGSLRTSSLSPAKKSSLALSSLSGNRRLVDQALGQASSMASRAPRTSRMAGSLITAGARA